MNGKLHQNLAILFSVIFVFCASSAAAAPNVTSLQGLLKDSTQAPLNGNFDVRIRVFDGPDPNTDTELYYEEHLAVPLSAGIFHLGLGNGINKVGVYDDSLFNSDNLWLEYAVRRTPATAWEPLSPLQSFASTSFALQSSNADTVDGMHGAALEESTEIDSDIATHSAAPSAHHAKTTSFAELTDTAADSQIPDTITVNHAASATNADTVDGQHASAFAGLSHFHSTTEITSGTLAYGRFSAFGDLLNDGYLGNASGDIAQNNNALQSGLNADMLDGLHESYFFRLSHNESVTGRPSFNGGSASLPPFYVGSPVLVSNLNADLLDGFSSASFAASSHSHTTYVNAAGDTMTGPLQSDNNGNGPAIKGSDTTGAPTHGYLGVQGATDFDGITSADWSGREIGVAGISTGSTNTDNYGVIGHANNVGVRGEYAGDPANNYGELGINGTGVYGAGTTRGVHGSGDTGVYGEDATYGNSGWLGTTSYGVYGEATTNTGRGVRGYSSSTGTGISYGGYFSVAGANGRGIYARGGANGYAAYFLGNVLIRNQANTATIMELGEGLDYAEGFDVSSGVTIEPGTVLIIDPDNPGKLKISEKAYDTRVAGIVAGANGLGSGVRLGADQFDSDVALAGRVYCKVDATRGAIKPGDLLTTASLAGYAMRANDYSQAQGAILGKAMETLNEGEKGQILVLVTLQ